MVAYEELLNADLGWAMSEGSLHFEKRSAVQNALRRIAQQLTELGIPYAVVGGMALFAHGFRRFTEDVDILVSGEDLKRLHDELSGKGYVEPFEKSKNLLDTQNHRVRIEFLVSGQYPGDGKAKPIAFPQPNEVATEIEGIRYVNLPTLVSLKLASGMTNVDRLRDLADVQELIKILNLPETFADQLHPYVADGFKESWRAVHGTKKRYLKVWRNKWLTADAHSLEEMTQGLRNAALELEAMRADGVELEPGAGNADDYAYLVTTDPGVARKYGMHEESEFLDEGPAAL